MKTEEEVVRWRLQSSHGMAAADLLIKAFNGDVQKALAFFYANDPEDHDEIHDFYVALHAVLFQLAEQKKR